MDCPCDAADVLLKKIQVGILKELYKQNLLTEKQVLFCINLINSNREITEQGKIGLKS